MIIRIKIIFYLLNYLFWINGSVSFWSFFFLFFFFFLKHTGRHQLSIYILIKVVHRHGFLQMERLIKHWLHVPGRLDLKISVECV